ncbi:helix-turn-helix domain-containing protein [Streptomyces mirabilis]|uniref:helix-turn-helix domain-containing protein n=1 Tax=Streptomyces mirabilis TaxID=68239 RepID=UPI003640A165
MTAELAAALDLLAAFVGGTPPPAACRSPRLSRAVVAVRAAARDAAVEYQRQQSRQSFVAASASPVAVLAAPQALSPLGQGEEITTGQAATIAGVTETRIRQLAAAGTIQGRKTPRNVWMVHLDDVRAYAAQRRTRSGTDGGTHTERAAG